MKPHDSDSLDQDYTGGPWDPAQGGLIRVQLNEDNYIGHPEQECSGVLVCMYIYSIVTEEMDWDLDITGLPFNKEIDGYIINTSFLHKLLPENWATYIVKYQRKFAWSLALRF